MGDAMAQVGHFLWKINMMGSTVQSNRTDGGSLGAAAIKQKEIQKGTHESLLYQHNLKALTFAIWADNNFVKTLSNFLSPAILHGGIKRRKRNVEMKRRDRDPGDVDCSAQQQTYYEKYHWIDKGNEIKAKYDL